MYSEFPNMPIEISAEGAVEKLHLYLME